METEFSVFEITSADEKSLICNKLLRALPRWFGNPDAVTDYTEQVKGLPVFACKADSETFSFLALKCDSTASAEIVVMGVLPEYHRQGTGKNSSPHVKITVQNGVFKFSR